MQALALIGPRRLRIDQPAVAAVGRRAAPRLQAGRVHPLGSPARCRSPRWCRCRRRPQRRSRSERTAPGRGLASVSSVVCPDGAWLATAMRLPPAITKNGPAPSTQWLAVSSCWRPITVAVHNRLWPTSFTTWRLMEPAPWPRITACASLEAKIKAADATRTAEQRLAKVRRDCREALRLPHE